MIQHFSDGVVSGPPYSGAVTFVAAPFYFMV